MNCEWVQQNTALYLYGELADDARHELEQHIRRCPNCAAELAAQKEFQEQMNALPVEEPSASFLAAARMRLQESLETAQQNRAWYHRLAFDPMAWMRQVRFSPALAMIIFLAGFGGGLGAMYSAKAPITSTSTTPPAEASIGGITSIEKQAGTGNVKVQYDKRLPVSQLRREGPHYITSADPPGKGFLGRLSPNEKTSWPRKRQSSIRQPSAC